LEEGCGSGQECRKYAIRTCFDAAAFVTIVNPTFGPAGGLLLLCIAAYLLLDREPIIWDNKT
jgi:hypothetical protein